MSLRFSALVMKISENNRKPRVLVLGASGLTGSAIASILDNGAADIEVVDCPNPQKKQPYEQYV
jgi:shikimate 5-dehydrogenase